MAEVVAMTSGAVRAMLTPRPGRLSSAIEPPIASTLVRTMSRPTPRPEIVLTLPAVVKLGRNTNCSAEGSSSAPMRSCVPMPSATARSRTFAASMPRPSSRTVMVTLAASRRAETRISPVSGFPALRRCSGVSMPWSTALRIRWVSGSRTASINCRSSSIAPPSATNVTFFPSFALRSSTSRPRLANSRSHGCVRMA